MTGKEPIHQKIKELEEEILKLKQINAELSSHEQSLIKKIKEYETTFYKELNDQSQQYKSTWTWRIGRLIVGPADRIFKLFRTNRINVSDKTTLLNNSENSGDRGLMQKITSSPDYNFNHQVLDPSKKNIAVIFDTFTHSCFGPEFNAISFIPSNWKEVMEDHPVDGLFIESAWRGYRDAWRDKIAYIDQRNQAEVIKLLNWAKNRNIPCIFWNKEDPVHFGQFISLAKNFNFIYTTDADCIPEYQKNAPSALVQALPFAAQPKIHNPIADIPRNQSVCFAGTYYNKRYHERKADMDFLLKPALDYGLEIYDRHFGDSSQMARNYRFPDIYKTAIRGKLDYEEMVNAYKQYKVFLNVNSVKYSHTMFARRVFELLASGTPVISTYSKGINNILGEGTVLITESEKDTRTHLEYLLGNELNWWKTSLHGLRIVMEHHTYANRTEIIFENAGLEYFPPKPVIFTVIAKVATIDEVQFLEKLVRHQTYSGLNVVLVVSGEKSDLIAKSDEIKALFAPFEAIVVHEDDEKFPAVILADQDSGYIAVFHVDKYYGPNYLKDFSIALIYSNPRIMGKKSYFMLNKGDQWQLLNKGSEYHHVTSVPHATLVLRKSDIDVRKLRNYLNPGELIDDEAGILSIDPFNYLSGELHLTKDIIDRLRLIDIDL